MKIALATPSLAITILAGATISPTLSAFLNSISIYATGRRASCEFAVKRTVKPWVMSSPVKDANSAVPVYIDLVRNLPSILVKFTTVPSSVLRNIEFFRVDIFSVDPFIFNSSIVKYGVSAVDGSSPTLNSVPSTW